MKTKSSHPMSSHQVGLIQAEVVVVEEVPLFSGKGTVGQAVDKYMEQFNEQDNDGRVRKLTIMLGNPQDDYS